MAATTPGTVSVFPATSERWPDIATLMGGNAAERGCWCRPATTALSALVAVAVYSSRR